MMNQMQRLLSKTVQNEVEAIRRGYDEEFQKHPFPLSVNNPYSNP